LHFSQIRMFHQLWMKCSSPHLKCCISYGSNGGGICQLWFMHLHFLQQSHPISLHQNCYSRSTNHVDLCAFYRALDRICLWKILSLSIKVHDLLPIYQPLEVINMLPLCLPLEDSSICYLSVNLQKTSTSYLFIDLKNVNCYLFFDLLVFEACSTCYILGYNNVSGLVMWV
jgi:hypothetical protein